MGNPVRGDVVWSIPTLATLNPLGAPIAHVGLHVGAVVHSYDTDLFLPPHRWIRRNPQCGSRCSPMAARQMA
jgi:hypothetical protein